MVAHVILPLLHLLKSGIGKYSSPASYKLQLISVALSVSHVALNDEVHLDMLSREALSVVSQHSSLAAKRPFNITGNYRCVLEARELRR